MAGYADGAYRRAVLYVPDTDDLYLIGTERGFALYRGLLAIRNLAGKRIFIGHIAWTLVGGRMMDIRSVPGARYALGADGGMDKAESAADFRAGLEIALALRDDEWTQSADYRMLHRRFEASKWFFGPDTTPEIFARFADYFVFGKRHPRFHPTMRGLRAERVEQTEDDMDD